MRSRWEVDCDALRLVHEDCKGVIGLCMALGRRRWLRQLYFLQFSSTPNHCCSVIMQVSGSCD